MEGPHRIARVAQQTPRTRTQRAVLPQRDSHRAPAPQPLPQLSAGGMLASSQAARSAIQSRSRASSPR